MKCNIFVYYFYIYFIFDQNHNIFYYIFLFIQHILLLTDQMQSDRVYSAFGKSNDKRIFMKIEKINEDQIRCTLTKEDLARRGIKVSELAYGTEKASALFRDMMEQAGEKFGFSADDVPIMAEAIPMNADCLVIVFTRVEDPEELDTRFSNFAPSVYYDEDYEDDEDEDDEETDFAGLFSRIQEGGMSVLLDHDYSGVNKLKTRMGSEKKAGSANRMKVRMFSFSLLMDVTRVARQIDASYQGRNTLYHNKRTGRYVLVLYSHAPEDKAFDKICLMLSEYGKEEPALSGGERYLEEHGSLVIRDKALQTLHG